MGHLGPLVLCTRAMNTLHFMEPYTMRATQVEVNQAFIFIQFMRYTKQEEEFICLSQPTRLTNTEIKFAEHFLLRCSCH